MSELKSLTLNGTTYDSFTDQTSSRSRLLSSDSNINDLLESGRYYITGTENNTIIREIVTNAGIEIPVEASGMFACALFVDVTKQERKSGGAGDPVGQPSQHVTLYFTDGRAESHAAFEYDRAHNLSGVLADGEHWGDWYTANNIITDKFVAEYGVSTWTEIYAAMQEGKSIFCKNGYYEFPMVKFTAPSWTAYFGGMADGQNVTFKVQGATWSSYNVESSCDDCVKTVNGIAPDENGNVQIETGGGGGGVQPDWNQNDSTKPDYVKNRTHYTETVQKSETREFTNSLVDAEFAQLLVANRKTAVFTHTNGSVYTYASDLDTEVQWVVSCGEGSVPQQILVNGDTVTARGFSSVTVNYEEETVHKLDAKYLSEPYILTLVQEGGGFVLSNGNYADALSAFKAGRRVMFNLDDMYYLITDNGNAKLSALRASLVNGEVSVAYLGLAEDGTVSYG